MAGSIQVLSEDEALEQIVETVLRAKKGTAPFTLVLGSGFSHGLVPTARELVAESLPLWMKSLTDEQPFETSSAIPAEQRLEIARDFWRRFVKQNAGRKLALPLDPVTGLPEINADGYTAAFNHHYRGAVGVPAQARQFQRALMRLDQPRLNAAHFLLASLLGAQPGSTRKSKLFKAKAAFSRLILTTNFDPFLQIALQSVNRLYFMSDTPELGVTDEVLDDETDAIHLVYLHGSIHRRSQVATNADIQAIKEKNKLVLAPVLKRRGVIVLGYSGWDDVIVEALSACHKFEHLLYWCGRQSDPLAKGAFGPRVEEILRKSTASYVQIGSAGRFMAQLCTRLVKGLPRLLDNPIGQIREMLETIDLKELAPAPMAAGAHGAPSLDGGADPDAIVKAQKSAIERLAQAEQAYLRPTPPPSPPAKKARRPLQHAVQADASAEALRLLSVAKVAEALSNYAESRRLCTEALRLDLQAVERAELLALRGRANYFLGRMGSALADWTRLIELPGAPVEQVTQALIYRAFTRGQRGDTDKELADYTRVIELPGAPVEHVALALVNRGTTWAQRGDNEKASADYTRVIEELPGAPVEQVADALFNRGASRSKQVDTDEALADYTRVTELPGASSEQVALALANRAWARYQKGAYPAFLADTEAALGKDPALDSAAFNLGLALLACERDAEALAAYQEAAKRFPAAIESYGLSDLAAAQERWLAKDRAEPAIRLLQSLQTRAGAAALGPLSAGEEVKGR
jgi:tetratricopeptide (TPR) repeat protein